MKYKLQQVSYSKLVEWQTASGNVIGYKFPEGFFYAHTIELPINNQPVGWFACYGTPEGVGHIEHFDTQTEMNEWFNLLQI